MNRFYSFFSENQFSFFQNVKHCELIKASPKVLKLHFTDAVEKKCSFLVVQRKLNEQTKFNIWSDLDCSIQASQTFANQAHKNIKKNLKNNFLHFFINHPEVFASWKRV